MELMGIEQEWLVPCGMPWSDLREELGLHTEFFWCMLEAATEPARSWETAADRLRYIADRVQSRLVLLPGATLPRDMFDRLSQSDVTADTPYYRWCWNKAGPDPRWLSAVGVHLNRSFSDEEACIRAANALQNAAFMFVALTANSPSADALSERMLRFPWRRYTMHFESPDSWRQWVGYMRSKDDIWPLKDRLWSTVAVRAADPALPADRLQIERLELRILEGGARVTPDLILGCGHLMERVIENGAPFHPLFEEAIRNDIAAARFGPTDSRAVMRARGKEYALKEILQHWVRGIPALEAVMEEGPPAAVALRSSTAA